MSDVLGEFREWKARWPDRLSTHYIGCYVNHHECMIHRLAAEVERLRNGAAQGRDPAQPTLTDAEREFLQRLQPSENPIGSYWTAISQEERKTVYALLARLGGGK